MKEKINSKKTSRGQASLILILLTAAALIFLAISMNWGNIAQTKALVTIAADQAAAILASDVASYGEMEKQTYLQNKNEISSLNGIIMAVIAVIVAIICLIITITTAGGGSGIWATLAIVLAAASVVMAIVNLALQVCVIQPGITSLWNKLQKNQPIQQQFYEGGLGAALQGAVTDQVNITDYFNLPTNGIYGFNWSSGIPNGTISRFALFYTDRLKMINVADGNIIPQVAFFTSQLKELLNGETCGQNAFDHQAHPSVPLNTSCPSVTCSAGTCTSDCIPTRINPNPSDPACQMKVPGFMQLNDACTDSTSGAGPYSPYCDPCCQMPIVPDPAYVPVTGGFSRPNASHPTPYMYLRPSSCGFFQPDCSPATAGVGSTAANPNDPKCIPTQCKTPANPYGDNYPYIYDPTYQEYTNGTSFLDLFGRDQQSGISPPNTALTAQGVSVANKGNGVFFPNGIYPFFWLMKDYNLEVDNLDPTHSTLSTGALHWCAPGGTTTLYPSGIPNFLNTTGFSDLNQLNLQYKCSGLDCCVNYLDNSMSGNNVIATSAAMSVFVNGQPTPSFPISGGTITVSPNPVPIASSVSLTVAVQELSPGSIQSVVFQMQESVTINGVTSIKTDNLPATLSTPVNGVYTATAAFVIPSTVSPGTYSLVAVATDGNGATGQSAPGSITVTPQVFGSGLPGEACSSGANCASGICNSLGVCDSAPPKTFGNFNNGHIL